MSCQVKLTATVADVPLIRRCLFPLDDLRGSDSWLQLCEISASSTGDIIAIGNGRRLVVLTANWDSTNSLSRYDISFAGNIIDNEDSIRTVLCLPIVVQSHSSQVGPEWTCIVIGFESGTVKFYTEDCKLLLSEQFHSEGVVSLKCHSQHSPRPDLNIELHPEEIYIHYPSNVCNINGNHLFTLLRSRRSQIILGLEADPDATSIGNGLKKWGFLDQFAVNDIAVVGLDLANTFDHLLMASTCGGFDAKYRAMAPHNNLVMAVGSKPFVAFHYALEGGTQPVLTDMAKAVANKLKSALPSWLTGSKPNADKQMTLALQPPEPMGCRFGICDLQRIATSIVLSNDRQLAVVTDILGRVILIDPQRGVVLRMFKGYRDAQCAFIQIPDERRSKHRGNTRVATFLIIYSPKKGTLEIFSAQQGFKISTFSASKYSVLLYANYGLMGFTTTSKSKYICNFTCCLIDFDGQIKEIVIPFHFALTEKNSKRARDLHLYKRLKQFIKNEDKKLDSFLNEALNTCMEIKTTEVQLQCLQMLMSCREITSEIILKCTEYFLEKYQPTDDDVTNDVKTLRILAENLHRITYFYKFVIFNSNDELDIENGNSDKSPNQDSKLVFGDKIISNLQKLLDLSTVNDNKSEIKVSFIEDSNFDFCNFLSAFDLVKHDKIILKPSLDSTALFRISELIFKQYIAGRRTDNEELKKHVLKNHFSLYDMLKMVLNYWVNRSLNINVNLQQELQNLSQLIYTLSKIEQEHLTVEYNKTSPFWTEIRGVLVNSVRPFPAFTAALICRSIAQRIEHDKELQQSGASLEDENIEIWEKLSQENCDWMLLIGKLEDISLLNIILSNKPPSSSEYPSLPKLKRVSVDISLKYVLEKGRGTVSELVAQWLTTAGVDPESIIINDHQSNDTTTGEHVPEGAKEMEIDLLFEHLNLIKKQFPHSLESSVLLANMCWEYSLAWQKELQEFVYLEAAIKCLNCIPQPHMKQGLYNLVWNTHLKIIFESACKLINKVGKLPKERLCNQDTGLSDVHIARFIGICTQFLDDFLEVVQLSYNSERVHIQYEGLWENENGLPLAELALQQTHINYDLLHAHYQLSLTIEMITKFTVKHTKPVNNLFEPSVISLFFTDLQQKTQVSWHHSDTKTSVSRTQFFLKVISASTESITISQNEVYAGDHVTWMSKCVALARVWNLDVDMLKRFQVIRLFANGFDSVAEEVMPTLTEVNKIGLDLLVIAAKRLQQYISSSSDLSEKITALSPSLTKYLDSLNGEWCAPSSLESILQIGTYCIRCLDEDQSEYKLACQLLEACSTLQDIKR